MVFEIRENRGRAQGRKKLVREREEYLRLVREGLNSKQACQIVGVNPRTGKRWRYGRVRSAGHRGASPITAVAPSAGPSRYLREDDRIHIADRLGEQASVRAIAAELGRSPSTISREIRRNRHPGNGQYRPHAAQARADARRPRPKTGKIAATPELRQAVQGRLEMEWSPEQISNSLLAQFPARRPACGRSRSLGMCVAWWLLPRRRVAPSPVARRRRLGSGRD
jgi:IS30 family transposase